MKTNLSVNKQAGVLLLEALIAILLFSIGILAVVGLQANAIKNVAQSQYRSEAALLADQLIGEMWANRANLASYAYAGGAQPPVLSRWITQTEALPHGSTYRPIVTVAGTAGVGPSPYTSFQISVTVFWQSPDERKANAVPHSHTATAVIPCC